MIKVKLMKHSYDDEGKVLSLIEFQKRFNAKEINCFDFYKIEFIVE